MSSSAGTRAKAGGKRKAPVGQKSAKGPTMKKARKPKGMPDFTPGETLVDLVKKNWRLGQLIGWGGFGALYYASENIDKDVDNKALYVAKVEPHSNGPLFGELAFYQRVAKEELLTKWIASKKLKYLGVPTYIGSGAHEKSGKKYRFMIMERYGSDVDQIFAECSKCFAIETVLSLAIRMLNVLEYIHGHGYVHADIKGSNLMMGYTTSRKNQVLFQCVMHTELSLDDHQTQAVFLVDYGLAYRFNPEGVHKEYKEDPKRRHDGTVEFTSRDAHKGVAPSRRTDLEILGYVMLQWLGTKLPWEDNLVDKDYVMNSKIKYMDNIVQLLKDCLKGQKSDELEQYLRYIVKLEYDEEPDYNKLRKIFQDGLKKRRFTDDGKTVKFTAGAGEAVELKEKESVDLKEKESVDLKEKESVDLKEKRSVDLKEKESVDLKEKESVDLKEKRSVEEEESHESPPMDKDDRTVSPAASPLKPRRRNASKKTDSQPAKAKKPTTTVEATADKKSLAKNEEKPPKKTRGRPRKPAKVMVDTATSP